MTIEGKNRLPFTRLSTFFPRRRRSRVMASCYACGLELPDSAFARDASKASGHKAICLVCDRAKSRAYYERNRERKIAAAKRSYAPPSAGLAAHAATSSGGVS